MVGLFSSFIVSHDFLKMECQKLWETLEKTINKITTKNGHESSLVIMWNWVNLVITWAGLGFCCYAL